MTLAESFDRLSGDELEIWLAEHSIEPFGDDWLQAGTIAACVLMSNRKPGAEPLRPRDFIPTTKDKKHQTPEEMAGVFESLTNDARRQ